MEQISFSLERNGEEVKDDESGDHEDDDCSDTDYSVERLTEARRADASHGEFFIARVANRHQRRVHGARRTLVWTFCARPFINITADDSYVGLSDTH